MSLLEHFKYQNDGFQFNIFDSDIGTTDVDEGMSDIKNIKNDVDPHLRVC